MSDETRRQPQPCDTCGAPATTCARDMLRHEDPMNVYVQFSPIGTLKLGCDRHPVVSEKYSTGRPREEQP